MRITWPSPSTWRHLSLRYRKPMQTAIADRDYIFEDELHSDGQSHCSDGAASAPSVEEVRTIELDSIEKKTQLAEMSSVWRQDRSWIL